jgi:hypothetical protein
MEEAVADFRAAFSGLVQAYKANNLPIPWRPVHRDR